MALLSTLQDDFTTVAMDTNKWAGNFGTLTFGGSTLTITRTSGASGYGGMDSALLYDLTGSYASCQVVNAGNQALVSWEVYPVEIFKDTSNGLAWYISGNTIQTYRRVAGVNTFTGSAAYVSATMKYFRIRESLGSIYYDYSTDGLTWTNFVSHVNPFVVTSVYAELVAGTWASEVSTTSAVYDNFNVFPGAGNFMSFM